MNRFGEFRSMFASLTVGALVLGAVGCGSDSDARDADDPPVTSGAAEDVDEEFDRSAVLRVGWYLNPTNLDPLLETGPNNLALTSVAYDRLTNRTFEGALEPMLAESWAYNNDGTELEMQLRSGVVFHDGTPFDAEAVRANIDRAMTLDGSIGVTAFALVDRVEVVDDLTVRFVSSSPNALLTSALADRAGSMVSPAAFGADLDRLAVGAGPYRMIEHRPGEVTVYERFDDYWDPEVAQAASVEIYYMPDAATRANAIRSGQIDITHLHAGGLADVEGAEDLVVETRASSQYYQVAIDWNVAPFGDVRVRRAMAHAIDRDGLCQAIMFGLCETHSQVFPSSSFAFDPGIPDDVYGYDPEQARALLAEADLPDGFEFDLVILAGVPPYAELSEAIKAQFADVGITANLITMEPARVAEVTFINNEYAAYLAARATTDPSLSIENYWLPGAPTNFADVTSERLQELYRASISTGDLDARAAVLREASQEIVDQVMDIVIAYPQYVFVRTDKVLGYQLPDGQSFSVRNVGIAR